MEEGKNSAICKNESIFRAGINLVEDSCVDGIGFLASDNLTASGHYEYGAIAGRQVTLNGAFDKEVFVAGENIVIEKNATLGRDVYAAASNFTLYTNINGDLNVAAGTVKISDATIYGDVNIYAGKIEFGENVVITGKLTYFDNTEVAGSATYEALETIAQEKAQTASMKNTVTAATISVLATIVTTMAFMLIAKKLVEKIKSKTEKYSWVHGVADFGIGLLTTALLPVVSILLLFTVVGFQVTIISLSLYVVMLFLSNSIFAIFLSSKLFKKIKNPIISAILMVLVLGILAMIPYVGGFITFISAMTGAGILLRVLFKK